jgi:hypothetical protein
MSYNNNASKSSVSAADAKLTRDLAQNEAAAARAASVAAAKAHRESHAAAEEHLLPEAAAADSRACGIQFPRYPCTDTIVKGAARTSGVGDSSAAARYAGAVETLHFKALCGLEGGGAGTCFSTAPCIRRITEHCLNPNNVDIDRGTADLDNPANRSMRQYPIFTNPYCRSAIKELIAETKANIAAGKQGAIEAATILHGRLSGFCAAHGTGEVNRSPFVAYSRYLAPARFVDRLVERDRSRRAGDGTVALGDARVAPVWRIRGVDFGADFSSREILSEDNDVLVLSLDVPREPPAVGVLGAIAPPYAKRATVTFLARTATAGGGVGGDKFAANGLSMVDLFRDFDRRNGNRSFYTDAERNTVHLSAAVKRLGDAAEGYKNQTARDLQLAGGKRPVAGSPRSSQIVIRASQPRMVNIARAGAAPQTVSVVPELSGQILYAYVQNAQAPNNTGRVVLELCDVYTNLAQFYNDGEGNCGCFHPFNFATDPATGAQTVVVPGGGSEYNTPGLGSSLEDSGVPCRYGWNQLPSPTHKTAEYERAGVGEFTVHLFKDIDRTGTLLPAEGQLSTRTLFDRETHRTTEGRVTTYMPLGAFELTGAVDTRDLVADLCACHMPDSMYTNFFSFLSQNGVLGHKDRCMFPSCANSSYPSLKIASPAAAGQSVCAGLPCAPNFSYDPETEKFATDGRTACPTLQTTQNVRSSNSKTNNSARIASAAGIFTIGILAIATLVALLVLTLVRVSKYSSVSLETFSGGMQTGFVQ